MSVIEVSFGGAVLRYTADRRGWLRQQAFGPRAGERADPVPAEALPLAYPAWGQDVSADPAAAGTRPLTHRLHRWVRAHATRDGDRVRPLVFNTWEATCFDFDQASLEQLMAGAAGLGAELFLLDDGWFGTEHPRTSDTRGLGDWAATPGRLPGGLPALTAAAKRAGLRFGLWVEPEMVNPQSVLYREHPDWVVAEAGRERREERSQLVLDLCRPEVAGFVTGTLSALLAGAPGISYLKWDANRDISEPGSGALPAAAQQNLWADTVRARWQVMAQVAEQWPGTELMACASGGGRADLGTLAWFHETWLSDNTDAGARLAMQWHASVFLPPQLLAAHVTRRGGQDVAFACAVAMSARFGFDLDPAALTGAELAACRRAAVIYRQVRDLVQLGDLFRLIAPDAPGSDGRVALGYAGAGAGQRAVIFGYQLGEPGAGGPDPGPCPVPMAAAGQPYRVRQLSLTSDEEVVTERDGASLLADGLAWPLSAGRTAALWLLEPA